jgi:hypothetical protein
LCLALICLHKGLYTPIAPVTNLSILHILQWSFFSLYRSFVFILPINPNGSLRVMTMPCRILIVVFALMLSTLAAPYPDSNGRGGSAWHLFHQREGWLDDNQKHVQLTNATLLYSFKSTFYRELRGLQTKTDPLIDFRSKSGQNPRYR